MIVKSCDVSSIVLRLMTEIGLVLGSELCVCVQAVIAMKKGHLCPFCTFMDKCAYRILSRVRQPIPPRSQRVLAILTHEIATQTHHSTSFLTMLDGLNKP